MRIRIRVTALVLSSCVVNGKAYGPTTSASNGGASTQSANAPTTASVNASPPSYPETPADPWAGIRGDEPVRWSKDAANHWGVRDAPTVCTARRDHCLDKDAWFIVKQKDLDGHWGREAIVAVFGPEGPVKPWNATTGLTGHDYVAFRTVPATKRNIAPGAMVIGMRDSKLPTDEKHAVGLIWVWGIVDNVDFQSGTYRMRDRDEPLALSGARVAVLSWKPGGKVTIQDGRQRDQLAVTACKAPTGLPSYESSLFIPTVAAFGPHHDRPTLRSRRGRSRRQLRVALSRRDRQHLTRARTRLEAREHGWMGRRHARRYVAGRSQAGRRSVSDVDSRSDDERVCA